jgi:flavin-dependent dehydrogenase
MPPDADALIIGAGPAGASTAIRLAKAGWRVVIVEQHAFPRQKVCGECIAPGNFSLLEELGVGSSFREIAGPELRQVGWMNSSTTITAELPECIDTRHPFGRALGRDQFDLLLLKRACALGAQILQPAKVRVIRGEPGRFACEIETRAEILWPCTPQPAAAARYHVTAPVIIDAHGSWEPAPKDETSGAPTPCRARRHASDLFAFKATFRDSTLARSLLPVLSFGGGYGGIVMADHGRATLACCIRRDVLYERRGLAPSEPAGAVVEAYLRRSCRGLAQVLDHAYRVGPWLSVGPIRPGIRVKSDSGAFRVGNAAGETHPLIGEGISMALQSSALLANLLTQQAASSIDAYRVGAIKQRYATSWRAAFGSRMRLASVYAHLAMHPTLATATRRLLRRWPSLLTHAARLVGKDRRAIS